jgi:hypothetical protein
MFDDEHIFSLLYYFSLILIFLTKLFSLVTEVWDDDSCFVELGFHDYYNNGNLIIIISH